MYTLQTTVLIPGEFLKTTYPRFLYQYRYPRALYEHLVTFPPPASGPIRS